MTNRYFGLDLAWSDHNPSGAAVLDEAGALVDERTLGTDEEVVGWVSSHLDDAAGARRSVIAADIPLKVPNRTGSRTCDRAVASEYGGRSAGPHPANRELFLRRYGRIRGEELAARLAAIGFAGPWEASDRTVFETYPHPGLVEVFELPERLRYKKGRLAERRSGLVRLRRLLAGLAEADPPLAAPSLVIPRQASGRTLKTIEDLLDARFCAWTALAWDRGATRMFGDPDGGHIVVTTGPVSE